MIVLAFLIGMGNNMPQWKTADIVKDLEKIEGVEAVEVNQPGGDVDSDNLIVRVAGAANGYKLHVRAFDDMLDDKTIPDQSNYNFPCVEITDGCDGSGGLVCSDLQVGYTYVRLRVYFLKKNFSVVTLLDDYF
jgi:hypothetical protein